MVFNEVFNVDLLIFCPVELFVTIFHSSFRHLEQLQIEEFD